MHRDIKPENLLVDSAGRVRIGDMGLSLAFSKERTGVVGSCCCYPSILFFLFFFRKLIRTRLGKQTTLAKHSVLVGTWRFMEPMYQEKGTLSTAVDVYAAGMTAMCISFDLDPSDSLVCFENVAECAEDAIEELLGKCAELHWPGDVALELVRVFRKFVPISALIFVCARTRTEDLFVFVIFGNRCCLNDRKKRMTADDALAAVNGIMSRWT